VLLPIIFVQLPHAPFDFQLFKMRQASGGGSSCEHRANLNLTFILPQNRWMGTPSDAARATATQVRLDCGEAQAQSCVRDA